MSAGPRIFIASASEGLEVANGIGEALSGYIGFEPRVWSDGTFKPGLTFIESLETELVESDFAVVTLTPDDQSITRGRRSMAPRDNVLLELGLFMGHLGRERTFFVYDETQDLKIPTDLLGVMPASYERREGQELREALRTACSSIAKRMIELGIRRKNSHEIEFENKRSRIFCEHISGTWWGRQWPSEGGASRLALLRIAQDHGTTAVRIDGDTFNETGNLHGRWRSVAIGLRVDERTLVFAWEGTHPTLSPGDTFGGFGQYTFDDELGICRRAEGLFADIQKGRKKPARWTSVELRRVDSEDLERVERVIKNGSDSARASEIVKAIDSFTQADEHSI